MSGNVACSFPNCSNPVIGQCTGYKGDCRKYYCATHSTDNLCYSCAAKKLTDENEALSKQEYLKIIGEMKNQAWSIGWNMFWGHNETKWIIGGVLSLVLLGFIFGVNNDTGTLFLGLGGFCIVIGILILFFEIGKQENILATNIDQQKTGFLNFFIEWKKEQRKKTWAAIGTVVGVIFLIALAAAVSGSKKNNDDD